MPLKLESRCECGRCQLFASAKELLAWVPPEVDYQAWRNTIWAVSDLLDHANCGADLVAAWSGLSLMESRLDPKQARRIYESDRQHTADHATGEANVDASFLHCMAVLCGGPFYSDSIGNLQHVARQHLDTLVLECGIEAERFLQHALESAFNPIGEQIPPLPDPPSPHPEAILTPNPLPYRSLGTAWGPLRPGILDEQTPPAPALLHFPTRQGRPVNDPLQGDTLIPMGEVGMLVAPGSTGKTMFLLQMLVAVATGTPFLGRFAVGERSRKRPVVMVCAEDRRDQIDRRLQQIVQSHVSFLPPAQLRCVEQLIHILPVSGVGFERLLLRTLDGVPQSTEEAERFTRELSKLKPSLVVLDPLSRLLSGNVDVSSEVGTGWVSMLEGIVRSLDNDVAVLFAHHSNKSSRSSSTLSREEDEPEARGTTGLFDGVRIEGYLKSLANQEVAFRIRKNNHGPRMEFKDRVILIRGEHGILRAQSEDERAARDERQATELANKRDQQDEDTKHRILVAIALHQPTSLDLLRRLVKRGAEPVRGGLAVLSSTTDGKSPLVRSKKKAACFEIDTMAVAERYPALLDPAGKALKFDTWYTKEWPKDLRQENFTVPLKGV